MSRSAKRSRRRRRARGTTSPDSRAHLHNTGPTPVMDSPLSMASEPVELQAAGAAIRSLLAAARR
jgi:hypothetical protein